MCKSIYYGFQFTAGARSRIGECNLISGDGGGTPTGLSPDFVAAIAQVPEQPDFGEDEPPLPPAPEPVPEPAMPINDVSLP